MKVIKDPQAMHAYSTRLKRNGKSIGFVPTMGALHEGHLSLVAAARQRSDIVVVSIFVNPTQFGPGEDLRRYPKNISRDKRLLANFDVDVLFLPGAAQMYPKGATTWVEVPGLSGKMCGRSRPGHFRGVATVVAKLFNIVSPDLAFFGEKDFQQQVIIKQMVKDLDLPVKVVSLPIIREFDGLALSSRNRYLKPAERKRAASLYRALCLARKEIEKGESNVHKILTHLRSLLAAVPGLRLDYAVIVDPKTLTEVKKIKGKVLVALAACLGKARLIDNLVVQAK
ncbi:pantoate--beta-alanine ligase [Candidatus Margulisiibacteriota bacterium]